MYDQLNDPLAFLLLAMIPSSDIQGTISPSEVGIGPVVLELFFSLHILPFIVVQRTGLFEVGLGAYTGLSSNICSMILPFLSLSSAWNKRVIDCLRGLWCKEYRGPPKLVVKDAIHPREQPEYEVLFKTSFSFQEQFGVTGEFSILITDQPPRNDRQIAEGLAKHILDKYSDSTVDYRKLEKFFTMCEEKGISKDYTNFKKFTANKDASVSDVTPVDEMVIRRIQQSRSVDYTAGFMGRGEYGYPLHGVPAVSWTRDPFVSARTTLFTLPWPVIVDNYEDENYDEGRGMKAFFVGEDLDDFTIFNLFAQKFLAMRLLILALDREPVQEEGHAQRESIAEQVEFNQEYSASTRGTFSLHIPVSSAVGEPKWVKIMATWYHWSSF